MASIRIDTLEEAGTGRIYAAAFAEGGSEPIAQSGADFKTHAEAEEEVIGLIRRAWPDRFPLAVDPVHRRLTKTTVRRAG